MKPTFSVTLLLVLTLSTFAAPTGVTVVNTAFTVAAGQHRVWTFDVYARGARVRGRFRAESDIECYIMDEDAYENFRTHHVSSTYYNSGRVTVANINVLLSEGRYYLVFSNGYSIISNKAVTANVYIEPPNR